MNKETKKFIEENIGLIEDNNFKLLYEYANNEGEEFNIQDLTQTLLDSDINPLNYLSNIPEYYLTTSNIKEFIIPDGIEIIGDSAFEGCNFLTKVVIPDSVNEIEDWAFYKCKTLVSITYKGTKDQWERITKHSYWKDSSNIKTIHCSDGDLHL